MVQMAIDAVNGRRDCVHCHPNGPGGDGDADGNSNAHGPGSTHSGEVKPLVQVTVALSTLLGLDDQDGELDGYGPILAELVARSNSVINT